MAHSQKILFNIAFCILFLCAQSWALTEVELVSYSINCIFCRIATIIFMLTAALASLIIILAGLRWLTSGEDPAARSAAKSTIVHVFVGIIIIFTAVYFSSYVTKDALPGADPTLWMDARGGACSAVCDPIKDIDSKDLAEEPESPEEESWDEELTIVFPEDVEHAEKIVEAPNE